MDGSAPAGIAGFASAGMLLGRWIVTTLRARKSRKWKADFDAAGERRQQLEWDKRAARATRVRPVPDPRSLKPGDVVDSTNAVNPRIPIWVGPPPYMRIRRLPPA
ncbi:MAG TPA: hypothetical protein VN806_08405 [Caulobacteraceae bacterium]|nr:hypothetical protein [Caulobacteraceae bacterium]